ncbi:unnamed protein product [Lota lota]
MATHPVASDEGRSRGSVVVVPSGGRVSLCGASRLILDYSLQHQGVALLLFTLIHFHGLSPAVEQLWP